MLRALLNGSLALLCAYYALEPGDGAVDAEFERRLARIDAEIDRLDGEHPWAGSYSLGGLGFKVGLTLAPSSGFVIGVSSCAPPPNLAYGTIAHAGDRIELVYQRWNDGYGRSACPTELVVVPWGERTYLVPPEKLEKFCLDVNSGWAACASGSHLLRRGDEERPVAGLPRVPRRYRELLLQSPIETCVLGIEATDDFMGPRITLDAGAQHGVRKRMDLRLRHPSAFVRVRIDEVGPTTSVARPVDVCPAGTLTIGSELSSLVWTR